MVLGGFVLTSMTEVGYNRAEICMGFTSWGALATKELRLGGFLGGLAWRLGMGVKTIQKLSVPAVSCFSFWGF